MTLMKKIVAVFAAGLVMTVVSMAVSVTTQAVLKYNVLELGGMRSANDPLMLLFFLHPWVLAAGMVALYPYVVNSLGGGGLAGGVKYGTLVWLVAGLPSAYLVFTSMNYPVGFTVNSVLGSILYILAGAAVISFTLKPKAAT